MSSNYTKKPSVKDITLDHTGKTENANEDSCALGSVSESNIAQPTNQRRNRITVVLIATACVLAAIIIPSVLLTTKNNDNGNVPALQGSILEEEEDMTTSATRIPSPTASPTPSPTTSRVPTASPSETETSDDFWTLLDFLETLYPNTDNGLQTPGSPQYRAAEWLANEDTLTTGTDIQQAADTRAFQNLFPGLNGNDQVREEDTTTRKLIQRYAMATVYFALQGGRWYYCENEFGSLNFAGCDYTPWLSPEADECDWGSQLPRYRNSCSQDEVGMLDTLTLPSHFQGVAGGQSLPAELALLTDLRHFSGSANYIRDGLEVLQNLASLQSINLQRNKLVGRAAFGLLDRNGNDLKRLELGGNSDLTGTIPWNNLGHLEVLDLSSTGVTMGSIPSDLESWSSLQELDLSNTKLGGSIPTELFRFENTMLLNLENAQMTGTIPEEIRFWNSTLVDLMLQNNQFTGSIPEAFDHLTSLENLRLEDNQLTGTISDAICAERGLDFQQFGLHLQRLAILTVDCVVECSCCDNCCGNGC